MDDILFCQKSSFTSSTLDNITLTLASQGLIIAPEKVQQKPPGHYFGWTVYSSTVATQKVEITNQVQTLKDVQKLVGDLQWVRNLVGISNAELHPLMSLLKGTDPDMPVEWTPEHQEWLQQLSEKVANTVADRRIADVLISLLLCNHPEYTFGLLTQWQNEKGGEEDHTLAARYSAKQQDILPKEEKDHIPEEAETTYQQNVPPEPEIQGTEAPTPDTQLVTELVKQQKK